MQRSLCRSFARVWGLMFGLLFSIAVLAADAPDDVPAKIARAQTAARQDWAREAMPVHATFARADADKDFSADIVFLASSRQKLYHVKDGPQGRSAGEEAYRYAPTLTGKVIDLPQALATARKQGMKGNLVTAELMPWIPHNTNIVVQVWRLVPDNDPNTADPNDPNMKNYYVDAVTGVAYDAARPDKQELGRGRDAMNKSLADDMAAFVKSLQQRK